VLTGCVGWRSTIDPHAARFELLPPPDTSRPAPSLLVTITADRDDKEQADLDERYLEAGMEVLHQSGRFSEVGPDLTEPDLELTLHIHEKQSFDGSLNMLSVMTLTAIPSYDRIDVKATGRVSASDGMPLAEIRVEESATMLIWLLALPLIPFALSTTDAVHADVFRSAIVQMVAEPAVWDPSQAHGNIRIATMAEPIEDRWARLERGMSIEEFFLLFPEHQGPETDPESVRRLAGTAILRLRGPVGTFFFEPCRRRNASNRCIQDGPHRLYRWSERSCVDPEGDEALAPHERPRLVTVEACQ
jgi:hypothetical protein